MLKIQSNLKINGMHWGLTFVDGVAYTANVSLAAKLLLKGYVVTDEAIPQEPDPSQSETVQLPASPPVETPAQKPTKPRKRAVTADAADESGV